MTPERRNSNVVLRYGRFFLALVGWRRFSLYALLTMLTTWTESVVIALLIPLFAAASGQSVGRLGRLVEHGMQILHLPTTISGVLLTMVIVATLKGLLTFGTVFYQQYLSSKATQDLRRRLLASFASVDYRYLFGTNTGRLSTIVFSETAGTSNALLAFSKLVPEVVTIAAYFVIVLAIDWRLVGLLGAAGVVAWAMLRVPSRRSKIYATHSTEESARFGSLLVQSIASFKYLTSTATGERFQARLGAAVRKVTVLGYKLGAMAALAFSMPQPVVVMFLALVLLFLVSTRGPQALATGFVMIAYLYRVMNELFALQTQWQTFVALTGSVDIVESTIDELDARREPSGAKQAPSLAREIEIRGLGFRYTERKVLENVALSIPRNSMVAFVGESGSGKTTLVDLVTGILKPTEGAVLVDGIDLRELDLESWRRRIGYVPQEAPIFDDSIANNISLWSCDPADPASMQRIREAARRAYCEEFILQTERGFDTVVGERGMKLSGGQRQRLAIARELFKRPEILILDEATSALDTESEQFIQRSVEELKGHATVLVIAHRLSTIKKCDRVFVLQDGRILEQGSYQELLSREGSRFQQLARLQTL